MKLRQVFVPMICGFIGAIVVSFLFEDDPYLIDKLLRSCPDQVETVETVECVAVLGTQDTLLIYPENELSVSVIEHGRIPRFDEDPPGGADFFPGPGVYWIEMNNGRWDKIPSDQLDPDVL